MGKTNKPRLGLAAAQYVWELETELLAARTKVAELEAALDELRGQRVAADSGYGS